MSAAVAPIKEPNHRVEPSIPVVSDERRSNTRYPLGLRVRYRTLGQNSLSGVGQAVNVSSGGVLVASRHEVGMGEEVEVRIDWPSPLEGWIPLQLVILGKVVRCGTFSFAVLFRQHQFRTMGAKIQPIARAQAATRVASA